jgi:crotonobetainyl-CoA:carnitine CoA-transferase CaiB-like acyl-CoA transferase
MTNSPQTELTGDGALAGVRVLDLTDDSGRFATKLLAELGADVVRVTNQGSPGRPMASPAAASRGGVLDWWYDGGKRRHIVDLDTIEGRDEYRQLASLCDLIIDTETPGRLDELGIGHADLTAANPSLTQVSITPFGSTGPRADWVSSDLVSSALGGAMAVTGLEDRPLNIWGRQAHNYAGFAGAIAGLAGLRATRVDGQGRHADVSIHESLTGGIENIFMQYFFDDVLPLPKAAQRQGALHWLRAYDLAKCRTGYTMITPTPTPELLVNWMLEEGHEGARRWHEMSITEVLDSIDDLMACVKDFVADYDSMDLWWDAQQRHCAFGGVHDIAAVADIPQFAHRNFYTEAVTDDVAIRQPSAMVKMTGTPGPGPRAPAAEDTTIGDLVSEWGTRQPRTTAPALNQPLAGLRVADFTWVLAGPYCTRMLGDLGADVIRIQNEERSTLVNLPDYPYYFVWNRSKRSATLNMKHPDALAAARRLIENCDVLIENFSAGVLNSWGLDWETVHEWNPRLIYVTMSGCGHDGPWQHVISYAPTVHAVCGITHLTNFTDRGDVGAGFSLNDHLAGLSAATTILAAVEARSRTGLGQKIDMAQLEIGTYAIGPAMIDYFANGHEAGPNGNVDGLQDHVPNEVYPTSDGFVAITVTSDTQWPALLDVVGTVTSALTDLATTDTALAHEAGRRLRRSEIDSAIGGWASTMTADDAMSVLQAAGVPAGKVQSADDLFENDPQHQAREFWQAVHHDVFGARHVDAFPAIYDGQRHAVARLSPAYLGEHNFEVWADVAGYEFDEVAEGMGDGLFS